MADGDGALVQRIQKWADGKATLRDVRGYSDDELFSIARIGYFFFYQGKLKEARLVFQGLYAINPTELYFAKALGVVEMASGNAAGAAAAYDVALRLAPHDANAYLSRAEVKLMQGNKAQALEDLRRAQRYSEVGSAENVKVSAMLESILEKR